VSHIVELSDDEFEKVCLAVGAATVFWKRISSQNPTDEDNMIEPRDTTKQGGKMTLDELINHLEAIRDQKLGTGDYEVVDYKNVEPLKDVFTIDDDEKVYLDWSQG
jgi:hypothetical protein